MSKFKTELRRLLSDYSWHNGMKIVENVVAKLLSIALIIVIFIAYLISVEC